MQNSDERFPGCSISREARIGKNVSIGYGTVVHQGVEIGEGTRIQEHCVLGADAKDPGAPLIIGPGATIRSHCVIYRGSRFGDRLETGHHVVLRENIRAGANLRVGNFSDIEGDADIGDYCRFHGYVHVGKGSRIGNFVFLFSLTTATNDPIPPSHVPLPVTVRDGAVVCVGATMMPGTEIGEGALISAGSAAFGVIPPGAVIAGKDGRIVNHVGRLFHLPSGTRHPWMRHFKDAFPEAAHPRIEELRKKVMENMSTLEIGAQP